VCRILGYGAALLTLALAGVIALTVPPSILRAQTGSVTISTDQTQYPVGATVRICYTVAGPGPVTITDTQADGANHELFSAYDDGTGYCVDGNITPPTGTECLAITAGPAGATGSNTTCFQVVTQAPSTGTGSGGTDCGQVSILGPPGNKPTNSGAQAAEDCFYQAYQSCTPATLLASISAVDAGTRHTFTLQGSAGACTIGDAQQHFVVPRPPQPATNTTCSGLSRTADGGLLFSNCGGSDVTLTGGS
jgi:hypothetical protein